MKVYKKGALGQPKFHNMKLNIAPDPITNNLNIELNEQSKLKYDLYCDHNTQEQMFMTEKKLDPLIAEMVQFCRHDPSAVLLRAFFEEKGITMHKAKQWCKKWPKFDEAYMFCKGAIGTRLFKGALNKVYDSGVVRTALPIFLEEFEEESKRMAELRTEQQQQAGNATFIIKKVDYSKESDGKL